MLELETKYSLVYSMFNDNVYHTVRWIDKYWAGWWTKLKIEQVMMHSLKNRGGLTRESGINETERTMWIFSSHCYAGIHDQSNWHKTSN